MSKLNQPTNLRVEDYPEQADWIGRMFQVLNPFIRSVESVFDSNIDYSTNIRSVSKDFDTTSLIFPIVFQWPFTQVKPVNLIISSATRGTTPTCLVAAWSFNSSTNEVSISYLTEFLASSVSSVVQGTRYKFTIRVTV